MQISRLKIIRQQDVGILHRQCLWATNVLPQCYEIPNIGRDTPGLAWVLCVQIVTGSLFPQRRSAPNRLHVYICISYLHSANLLGKSNYPLYMRKCRKGKVNLMSKMVNLPWKSQSNNVMICMTHIVRCFQILIMLKLLLFFKIKIFPLTRNATKICSKC